MEEKIRKKIEATEQTVIDLRQKRDEAFMQMKVAEECLYRAMDEVIFLKSLLPPTSKDERGVSTGSGD